MRYVLDAHSLRAALPVATVARIDLEVFESIDSTNAHLMRQPATVPGRMAGCVARSQTAGRGRHGRDWISPDGRGIYLSVGWTFEQLRTDAPALSLAVGVSLLKGLVESGARGLQLKWPNDLVTTGGKLGGILIEMRPAGAGACVVVGVGINVSLPPSARSQIKALGGLEPRDLADAGLHHPDESLIGARLVDVLLDALERFSLHGFAAFREDWLQADSLYGQSVEWMQAGERLTGIARGIGPDGSLLVDRAGIIERLVAGDVTLRPAA